MSFPPDSPQARVVPSPNHDARGGRPDLLLLHYTGMATAEAALARLIDPTSKVSAHYLVHENGEIVQLVPEARRAWHAGVSHWQGEADINARSIGIEIVNPGTAFGYRDFPRPQVDAVIALCRDIVARHAIRPDRVLGHSDVAPGRKDDPGERFPWARLAAAGVGLWVEPAPIGDEGQHDVAELQRSLARFGYGLEVTGRYDQATSDVVAAFQRHFRPARIDGRADRSTTETLRRLLAARDALAS